MSIDIWVDGSPAGGPHENLSNANFATIAQALGFYDLYRDDSGRIPRARLAELRRRVIELRSRSGAIEAQTRPGYVDATPGRATVIECGADADYVGRRLEDFDRIFAYAQQHGRDVLFG